MRIPIIESSYTPRAQGSGQIATPMASTIGAGLQQIGKVAEVLYQDRANDMQEQIKANQIIAQSKWQNQMFETKKKLTENIDTDGDYASARDRWQAESEKLISGIEKQKDLDPTWKESVIADLRRDQIQSDFQIGAAIKQRRKSEVASAANLNATMATERFIKGEIDQAGLAKALGGAYGSAAGVGAIDGNEATLKMRNAIGGAIANKAKLMAQDGDVAGALSLVESAKKDMPVDDYISTRGALTEELKRVDIVTQAEKKLATGKALDADESSVGFQSDMQNGMSYGEAFSKYAIAGQQVPTQVSQQINAFSNISPDIVTANDAESLAVVATQYSQLSPKAAKAFTPQTQYLLRSLETDIKAGIAPEKSVKDRLTMLQNSTVDEATKPQRAAALKKIDEKPTYLNAQFDGLFSLEPKVITPALQNAYRDRASNYVMMGHDPETAREMAAKDVKLDYGVYNSMVMRNPPTMFISNETVIEKSINSAVQSMPFYKKDYKYTIISDEKTNAEVEAKARGEKIEVTYPLYEVDDAGVMRRVQETKDGKVVLKRHALPTAIGEIKSEAPYGTFGVAR